MMLLFLSRIGRYTLSHLAAMGRMFLFLLSALALSFRPPAKIRLILYHIKTIGVDSLSVVVLSGFFTGMVMGFQGYYSLRKFNAESWLGSATALGLLRELGPVLSAFMVTGRTGSAMAAELGTMRATEQIDALYSMAINPIKYLVSPRIIASLIAMPLLTAIFDVVGIYGAYLVGVGLLGVSSGSYFSGMESSVVFHDVYSGLIKSVSFGLIITWVCCYKGFHAPPMATGVSQATTESVVLSFVFILVWDYFLTAIML
ncbi:MAG: ABC transporter permease [Deltaproteobacteria bacterium GWA2_57_13]|nr:MAG: ABC transporter permease [Deltaproteobacteria bacterium GWA2_57_13]OGQ51209.1 MAG: ABC transporter permease [Deltaproteobacteria bacterium RIFCSPLOWO2_02_FULL_57_26]OGQ75758.1 MAG: ABC transporter permease [Deltaproteobacteria bacterium RIFCSPLOWO2_12_FULL_57_22]